MIDRELREALAVDPAPDFVARVRERIGHEEIGSPRWSWQPIAIAIAAIAVLVVTIDRARLPSPGLTTMPPRMPMVDSTPLSPMGAVVVSPQPKRFPQVVNRQDNEARRRGAAETEKAPDAEVLISASEARAIRNLLDGVRNGRIDLSSLPLDASQLEEIVLAPIVLPPAGPGEGVRQ